MRVWREDGVPANVPMFITESNISSAASESSVDIFGALWLADYVGAFLTAGGNGLYYFHYIPSGVHRGCNNSDATFGLFAVNDQHQLTQPLGQFFASQLINLQWLEPGEQAHEIYSAASNIRDGAGHTLVTAYAVKRPDGQWALLIINKDQENSHHVKVSFEDVENGHEHSFAGAVDMLTFGRTQYNWDPLRKVAAPDGPPVMSKIVAGADTHFELPAASIVVLKGKMP
jgi:hypothetical protein